MDIREVERRVEVAHAGKVKLVRGSLTGFKNRAEFIDEDFGRWTNFAYAVCRGQRHPERARVEARLSVQEVQGQLDKKFHGLVKILPGTWKKCADSCTFEDIDYGQWDAYLQNVLQEQCHGHPLRSKMISANTRRYTQEEIQELLPEGVTLVVGTYTGMLEKATFIDPKYGSYEAYPVNLVHHKCGHLRGSLDKFKNTNQKRYGVAFPMQDPELALKNARARNNSYIAFHWKTGKELVCQARWELWTVNYFNENKIEFLWQSKTFKLSNSRTYRPDLYLIEKDTWVDIKGYHTNLFLEKWAEFKLLVPKCEIWDKLKLKELGILTK